jgi:hypothetical protein
LRNSSPCAALKSISYSAVQAETHGTGGLAAIEVINEQRLNSLSHEMVLIPSGEGNTKPRRA